MNKAEMVKAIAADAGLTQKDVNRFLLSQEKVVVETLRQGGSVNLVGFLAIKPVARAARTGRSLATGSRILIPEKVGVQISAGKTLKDATAKLDYADFAK